MARSGRPLPRQLFHFPETVAQKVQVQIHSRLKRIIWASQCLNKRLEGWRPFLFTTPSRDIPGLQKEASTQPPVSVPGTGLLLAHVCVQETERKLQI